MKGRSWIGAVVQRRSLFGTKMLERTRVSTSENKDKTNEL